MGKKLGSNTAIIYFSLTPPEEAKQKSFISGGEFYKNFRIAGALRSHVRRQIDQTDLPLFLFDEHNQIGETFGEKFVSAVETVFNEGFGHVIVVGNDTPRLESGHVLKAANELQNGGSDIVLGPAGDGGTWLMGFSRRPFDAEVVENLSWNTDNLLNSVISQLGESNKLMFLETFDDLDSYEDLQKFLKSSHTHKSLSRLKKNLLGIIESGQSKFFLHQTALESTDQRYNFLLRGPPFASDFYRFS